MMGYYNNNKATDEVIKEYDGKKRYISGDLGYMDEDGFVYYLNREKDLIVGPDGFKIIPSVIEDVVCENKGCQLIIFLQNMFFVILFHIRLWVKLIET